MTRYDELKSRQKAAILTVFTLGIAAVPISTILGENILEGTSINKGAMPIVGKLLTVLFLVCVIAIPAFIIALVVLIVTTIQLSHYK